MDSVDIVVSTCRTLSRVSVNNVYGLRGQSPSSYEADWTMSTVPWTLSSETMDIVHCTLDFVHGLSGQSPWTLSSLPEFPGLCPLSPWILSRLSTESIGNVQGSPWRMSMESTDTVDILRRDNAGAVQHTTYPGQA